MVAFANSVRPGHTAVILIGEKDDGTIQGVGDADNIQKKIRSEADKIYPPILWKPLIYEKNSKTCIRIEIEYDGDTPHFGGISWIRKGSETIKSSDEIFQKLIELRLSKVREIAKWIDRQVSVRMDRYSFPGSLHEYSVISHSGQRSWHERGDSATIISVNAFYANLLRERDSRPMAEPLEKMLISFDHEANRLELIVKF